MTNTNIFIKILLIVGVCLTVLGGIILSIAMASNGWDFGVLASHVVEPKTVEISQEETEKVSAVKIDVSTADVSVVYHDEQKITVLCYNLKTVKGELTDTIDVSVKGNNLEITKKAIKKINFQTGTKGKAQIMVKLPKNMVVNLSAVLSTGNVYLGESGKDFQFKDIKISLVTGDVKLDGNVDCEKVSVETTTGDVYFNGNLTCETCKLSSTTGDVFVNGEMKTDLLEKESSTGDFIVNKSIVSGKIDIEQNTGHFKCNAYITADEIDVETTTGDVTIKLLGSKNDYTYVYEISTGRSNVSAFSNGDKRIDVETTTGNVYIYFEQ